MSQTPYEVLGIIPGADSQTIDAVYQHLTESLGQPGPEDAALARRLEDICWAYHFLTDPDKRARYDALTRHSWPKPDPVATGAARITRIVLPVKSRPNAENRTLDGAPRALVQMCDCCGKIAPVQFVTFNQNIGMLFTRRHDWVEGSLCRDCIEREFWKMTGITLLLGWWGLLSLLVTPDFLLGNVTSYLESRGLERPKNAPPPRPTLWKYFTFLSAFVICSLLTALVKALLLG
jgi:hypothetical protein